MCVGQVQSTSPVAFKSQLYLAPEKTAAPFVHNRGQQYRQSAILHRPPVAYRGPRQRLRATPTAEEAVGLECSAHSRPAYDFDQPCKYSSQLLLADAGKGCSLRTAASSLDPPAWMEGPGETTLPYRGMRIAVEGPRSRITK